MKVLFASIIAGSFLFVGCGGGALDYPIEKINKRCECMKLKKDGDKEGAKACKEEYKAWKTDAKKEFKEAIADMDPDELKEAQKEGQVEVLKATKACKDSLE